MFGRRVFAAGLLTCLVIALFGQQAAPAKRVSLAGPQSDVQGRMVTATTGTGTMTLGAAAPGATTFATMPVPIVDGDLITYQLIDIGTSPVGKERGVGTYHSAGPTLSRDAVIWSTNGNVRLNLSGNAYVFVTADEGDYLLAVNARILLNAAKTFYVSTAGNDGNNCLTSGTACATFARITALIAGGYDFGGQTVTVLCPASCNFTTQLSLLPWVGGGSLIVDLGGGQISTTSLDAVLAAVPLPAPVTLQNLTLLTTTAGAGIAVSAPAIIKIGAGVVFGATAFSHISAGQSGIGQNVTSAPGGGVQFAPPFAYTISGSANQHVRAAGVASANFSGGTITLTGTPNFRVAFAVAREIGLVDFNGTGLNGSATGAKYLIDTGGGVFTNNGGASLPGTVAGSSVTPPGWLQ
jgi:hypothetical protein